MSDTQIQIRGEPFSNVKCKFIVDRPVYDGRSHYFGNAADAEDSPLAKAIFAIQGVTSVLISHNEITVGKGTMAEWPVIGRQVGIAIREQLGSGVPAVSDAARAKLPAESDIRQRGTGSGRRSESVCQPAWRSCEACRCEGKHRLPADGRRLSGVRFRDRDAASRGGSGDPGVGSRGRRHPRCDRPFSWQEPIYAGGAATASAR